MKAKWTMLTVLMLTGLAWGDDESLLNQATAKALESARASLAGNSAFPNVARIGVAQLNDDETNVTALLKSMLTKSPYDVVLTSDSDWGPLLDEFARQVKREDLMKDDTVHELRAQGVDAVLYGTVERASVEQVTTPDLEGPRATVRMLLNLASLSEEHPGSLLWSEQVTGTVSDLKPINADKRLIGLFAEYRLVVVALAVLLTLLLLIRLFRYATTPV